MKHPHALESNNLSVGSTENIVEGQEIVVEWESPVQMSNGLRCPVGLETSQVGAEAYLGLSLSL